MGNRFMVYEFVEYCLNEFFEGFMFRKWNFNV